MARIYPSAGSVYTYVAREIHPTLGFITGWSMVMDYLLNPLICTAFSAKAAMNIIPGLPFYAWLVVFAVFFTWVNLHGIKSSARLNEILCLVMILAVIVFFGAVVNLLWRVHHDPGFFLKPFYDPPNFKSQTLFAGTSVAVLTYIGFDAISTLSEEAENPRRNILLATVLVCVFAGVLSGLEVYAAQLVWGSKPFAADRVESAFALISQQVGGVLLFQVMNFTLLVANAGTAIASQLAAGRLLYGMGQGNAIPKSFFGAIEPNHRVPRNGIVLVGVVALIGAATLEFFSGFTGGSAYAVGAQALNFGAFISFMGVNAASFTHYWWRGNNRSWSNLLVPVLGFVICGFIWFHLSSAAMILGAVWMALGIAYGAIRTRGFRTGLVRFDLPPEET
jgi:amino acid transporter